MMGIYDACWFPKLIIYFLLSKPLQNNVIKSVLLNGFSYLLCSIFVNIYFPDIMKYIITFNDDSIDLVCNVDYLVDTAVLAMYCLLLYPLYCISNFLAIFWNSDIANIIHFLHTQKKSKPKTVNEINKMIVEEIYNQITMTSFFLQIAICFRIPYIGTTIGLILLSWFYATSSFDYKWSLNSINFMDRIYLYETHWEYMLGYGFTPAIMTVLLPKFIYLPVLAVLTPLFIMNSIVREPISSNGRIPIFQSSKKINLVIIRLIRLLVYILRFFRCCK
jgi:hypothetical protein